MTLHCVYSGSHATTAALASQLAEGDCILLLGDACALALPGNASLNGLNDWRVYALDEDLAARGIEATDSRVPVIDYEAWLDLALQQANQRLWR